MSWAIPSGADVFQDRGTPTFLLADTLWAAFAGPTRDELRDYADLRRRQGFTAVLINILTIDHDRSGDGRRPFPARDGHPDLDTIDPGYLAEAVAALEIVTAAGLTPVLVLLWNNFVPGSWGARLTPELVMTPEQTDSYLETVLAAFDRFDPLYLVSGDDNFDSAESIERYRRAAATVRRVSPGALVGWHTGPMVEMDEALAASDAIDFYAFQSAHEETNHVRAQELAAHYLTRAVRRPILNLEPGYEGHGFDSGRGRHTSASVRRASWSSVLAGASAGLGYGAHGVWSWHRRDQTFTGEWYSGTPYPASVALAFPGAWDVGLLRQILERHELVGMRPDRELVGVTPSGVLAASIDDRDRIAVYRPHAFAVTVEVPAGEYDLAGYDLAARRNDAPRSRADDQGRLVLEQPEGLGDSVVVLSRRRHAHA